ncbi:efflux RND transporter periplasmic adaptor subunit [Pedobacter arcticus]|uniref:efflux RND transporter periplasmic adaptor subunit n=1 Tax=Pedobacter arcticus TaxID=752140 RepID=UPI00030FC32E|nr:efflux RND transporter periplasmic adaptor subunit [Pedobacter arcticus]
MKSILKLSLPAIAVLLIMACNNKPSGQSNAAQQALSLPVIEVPTKTVTAYTTYPTNIEGMINSEVRAKVGGYITDVLVDEGQQVSKGQVLFRIETQSLTQDADAAKANVNAAQVEVDKLKPLVAKNIISSLQLATANAKLQQAKSSYNSIAANIGYGTIKSPVNGFVGSIKLRKGSLVSPSDQIPLTTVSEISNVYAYFSMNEKEYLDFLQQTAGESKTQKIKNFPKVTLVLANGAEYPEKGTIETINAQINPNTGTVSFRALFSNKNGMLNNGNSGTIKVPTVYKDAVVIPQESTFEQQEKTFVYKLSKDTTALAQSIEIKANTGNVYVVGSGIKNGEKIVAKGVNKVREGLKIKPQLINFDSIAQPIITEFK